MKNFNGEEITELMKKELNGKIIDNFYQLVETLHDNNFNIKLLSEFTKDDLDRMREEDNLDLDKVIKIAAVLAQMEKTAKEILFLNDLKNRYEEKPKEDVDYSDQKAKYHKEFKEREEIEDTFIVELEEIEEIEED